jgi:hypothetical protein
MDFKPAHAHPGVDGLLYRCRFHLHGTIGVRADLRQRKADGSPYLAFPRDRSCKGRLHSYLWPVTPEVQAAIELQVIHAARSMGLLVDPVAPDAA